MNEEHVDVVSIVKASEADEDAAFFDADRPLPRKLLRDLRQAPLVSGRPCVELAGGVIPALTVWTVS